MVGCNCGFSDTGVCPHSSKDILGQVWPNFSVCGQRTKNIENAKDQCKIKNQVLNQFQVKASADVMLHCLMILTNMPPQY